MAKHESIYKNIPDGGKISDLFDITGKAILITGGAGKLGQKFAETLAANGAHLILADLRHSELLKMSRRLTDRYPSSKILPVCCDVGRPSDVKNLFRKIKNRFDALYT